MAEPTSIPSRTRVLLADDNSLDLRLMTWLLEPTCEIVATAVDGEEAVIMADRHHPDIVVLDVAMPFMNGLEAGRLISNRHPRTRLIYVTSSPGEAPEDETYPAGACAFFYKHDLGKELPETIGLLTRSVGTQIPAPA